MTERQKRVIELADAGYGSAAIAAELGVHVKGVPAMIRRARAAVDRPRKTRQHRDPAKVAEYAARDRAIWELAATGAKFEDIAAEIHKRGLTPHVLTRQRISTILRRV